jgi:hypothetical protein
MIAANLLASISIHVTVSIGTQATIISILTHILNPLSFFNNLEIDKTPSMNLAHTLLETKLYNKPLCADLPHP